MKAQIGGPFQRRAFLPGGSFSERPGAVKGAPQFGAAQRTLDGEDRSETVSAGKEWSLTAQARKRSFNL